MEVDPEAAVFPRLSEVQSSGKREFRKIAVPPHRLTPLREHWDQIVGPIVEHLKLQIRMNTRLKRVELRSSESTEDPSVIQKAADFIKAFTCGFSVEDSVALLRLEDIYLETFEIKDVKTLHGDNLSRCIGRLAGEKGKTKNAIENSTRTRIVLADSRIHILGSYANIQTARRAICDLILGRTPGRVYSTLRSIAKRMRERGV